VKPLKKVVFFSFQGQFPLRIVVLDPPRQVLFGWEDSQTIIKNKEEKLRKYGVFLNDLILNQKYIKINKKSF
jgi:hypothetical protein